MAPAVVERLVGWAFGVVARLVGWFAGLLGGAGRWVGRQVRSFMEPLLAPLRLLYAYVAARIGTWVLGLVLMVLYCIVAAVVAVVLYLFLYHNFVPIIAFHKPVYLDFTRAEPWAVADFAGKWSPSGRLQGADYQQQSIKPLVVATPVLSPGHLYDFALDLQLPESPINDQIGMFMVTLSLYSWNGELLANSSRPCRIRYKTDLLQKMWTVFWSLPLVLGLMEEKQALRLELLSEYVDTHVAPFGYATVSLSHRELEVYSAHLHIEARLSGISYFCYYWFFTAMAVFVPLIFLAETWLIILTWLVIYFLLPAVAPSVAAAVSAAAVPGATTSSAGIGVTIPVSPAERQRRIAGISHANQAAAVSASAAAAAAAPLAALEELGHEARSPSLPRPPRDEGAEPSAEEEDEQEEAMKPVLGQRTADAVRRDDQGEEEEEEDLALQELLEREIARKLAVEARHQDDEDDEDDEEDDYARRKYESEDEDVVMVAPAGTEEGEHSDDYDDEDDGAGVFPRIRRRRPIRAAVAAAQLEGAIVPPTTEPLSD